MLKEKNALISVLLMMVLVISACSNTEQANSANNMANNLMNENETVGETENAQEPDIVDEIEQDDHEGEEVVEDTDIDVEVSYANDLLPIFTSACQQCHGDSGFRAGLSVVTYEDLMAGSNNGLVVLSGDADASKLVKLLLSGTMPKNSVSLSSEQIQLIKDWINQGALDN